MLRGRPGLAAESERARLPEDSLQELEDAFTPLNIGDGAGGSARVRVASARRRSPDSDEADTPGQPGHYAVPSVHGPSQCRMPADGSDPRQRR